MYDIISKDPTGNDCIVKFTDKMRILNFFYSERNTDIWRPLEGLDFKKILRGDLDTTDRVYNLSVDSLVEIIRREIEQQTNIYIASLTAEIGSTREEVVFSIFTTQEDFKIAIT